MKPKESQVKKKQKELFRGRGAFEGDDRFGLEAQGDQARAAQAGERGHDGPGEGGSFSD